MKLYSIKDWEKNFEVRDTNRVDGPLKWVPVPTKTDGFGFSRMAAEKDFVQLLACWYMMLGIAAKQERTHRGRLMRDERPLSVHDMSIVARLPESMMQRAVDFFSDPIQGWLSVTEISVASPVKEPTELTMGKNDSHISDAKCASTDQRNAICAPTGQDRTGQDITHTESAPAKPSRVFVAPTPEEVEAYSREIKYPLDGQAWCDSYAQKGWLVGRAKMKDWRAAVRNWKANEWRPNSGSQSASRLPDNLRDPDPIISPSP